MPNLTNLIDSPRNAIGQFCRESMAGKAAVRETNKELASFGTVLPEGAGTGYPWMLIGTAFDYRVRLFFEPEFNFENTLALGREPVGRVYFTGCENTAWALWKAGTALTPEQRKDDDYLARLCVIAAHLEGVWRSGIVGEWFETAEMMVLEQLLESVPDAWTNDLTLMARKLALVFEDRMPERVVSNPVLGRSELNIKADGDLILDDCLIDVKATKKAKVSQAMLHQLVCYALLDNEDRFAIRNVGLYMARQGALKVWTIPELLMMLDSRYSDRDLMRAQFEEAALQL